MTARNFERSTFKLKRDNERAYRYQAATARKNAAAAMTRYAEANGISCFVCKTLGAEVAKMDQGKHGTWMLCVPCAKKRRLEQKKARASGQ